jgi:16S rRNA (guanine966-N2)-methyltransferase
MRVIAGTARGRSLQAPPGIEVRPTTDRARQATFNALESRGMIDGAVIVDLFAGSGAVAIEAISRGAEKAVIVESNSIAIRCIKDNLAHLGFATQAIVVRSDVMKWLPSTVQIAAAVDQPLVVFVDPPYKFDHWPELLAALVKPLRAAGEHGIAVFEGPKKMELPEPWVLEREHRYGLAWITMAYLRAPDSVPADSGPADSTDAITG